ncbi:hypothetical protein IAQ61_005096 [Plenodomus lingam]|uniref:uncharacterized protein n=1 Tax=Leptosphaeria maculans TaxID=5022 RepID=UPI00332E268D|nr:hypothetical protein IAQ61_005096 [Plenodomus lingam]
MEKMKNVLHGHKKTEETTSHNPHASPPVAAGGAGETHPIYDQMTERKEGKHAPLGQPVYEIKTTSGEPYTTLAQPRHAVDGKHGHESTSATTTQEHRPDAKTSGTEMSTASIKSGVIGFGPGEQGHAALPTQNSIEQNLSPDHVVGGGNLGNSQGNGLDQNTTIGSTSQSPAVPAADLGAIKEQQPYGSYRRQESYTVDTNRIFPLAGGVTSHHGDGPVGSTTYSKEDASTIPSVTQTSAAQYPAEPTSTLHEESITGREPDHHQQGTDVSHSHGREALAGAAAAAATVGATQSRDRSDKRDVDTHGHTFNSAATMNSSSEPGEEQGLLAKAKNLIGLGTTKEHEVSHQEPMDTTSTRSAQGHHLEAVDGATNPVETGDSVTGSFANERPQASRLESHHRHIPGEFISTPGEHGNTFLDYTSVVQPASTLTAPALGVGPTPISAATATHQEPTSTLGSSTGTHSTAIPHSTTDQHELRHTGTLDDPLSRSSEDHHHDRDAVMAGGLGAGAAGLAAHSAHQSRATTEVDASKPLYEETSPYSSKMLDPRVSGVQDPLEEHRFDSQASSTGIAPSRIVQTSSTAGNPSASGSQHHPGRDAGIMGGAAVGGAALQHSLQRNNAPGSGSTVLPHETAHSSIPASSAPHHSTNLTAPPASSTVAAPHDEFYGTRGAPAPMADHTTQPQQSSMVSAPTSAPDKDAGYGYGRNAAIAGAGALGAAGVYTAARGDDTNRGPASSTTSPSEHGLASSTGLTSATGTETGPASKTIGPHSSNVANILDPRIQPDPALQKSHNTTGPHQSDTFDRLDPQVDGKAAHSDHHYGRDAAVVGGAGAAGYGAHEAIQAYGNHRMTQPSASMNEQRYDPTTPGANAPSPVAPKSEYNYNDPTIHSNVNRAELDVDSNTGRNAGLEGLTGPGLVGAGAYAGSRHAENNQQLRLHQTTQDFALGSAGQADPIRGVTHDTFPRNSANQTSYPTHETSSSYPAQGAIVPQNTQALGSTSQRPYDATRDPADQGHDKRNAALLGAGGAAAIGGGAYAFSQRDDGEQARLAEREQERLKKEAHDREKERHRLEKEQHKHEKEVHKHEKAIAAHETEQHNLHNEQEKEQKLLTKEQHEREKQADKADKEKKGGLLGFLHRDKSKKEKSAISPEPSPRASREHSRRVSRDVPSPRHSKEYPAGTATATGTAIGADGATGAATTTTTAHDENHPDHPRWKGKHLLHKDPPKGHPAREVLEQ